MSGKITGLIELTGIEFDILYMLARRPMHVFTRDNIIEHVWKHDSYCVPKAVDVHIGHIRRKIEDNPSQSYLYRYRARNRLSIRRRTRCKQISSFIPLRSTMSTAPGKPSCRFDCLSCKSQFFNIFLPKVYQKFISEK